MAELPGEKIHALREAIARLRCAAHDVETLLAEIDPSANTTAVIDPSVTNFMQKVLPEDEKQRLTKILPQLAERYDSSGAARARKPPRRRTSRPKVLQS
ncbi:MAG TPA: hypothetical protein VFL57_11180 [Bryobacteraceae bacterium]|nr:hypothetical protein [Bryobacteraceae bacterium]